MGVYQHKLSQTDSSGYVIDGATGFGGDIGATVALSQSMFVDVALTGSHSSKKLETTRCTSSQFFYSTSSTISCDLMSQLSIFNIPVSLNYTYPLFKQANAYAGIGAAVYRVTRNIDLEASGYMDKS